jgi:predicted dehydrogenase
VNLALIGCGRMGRQHLAAASRTEGVQVAAVVDPAPPVELACSVTTLEQAFAADIDGVLVASPTPTHAGLVRLALERGKHVLCEKPLTLEQDDDLALAALAERLGLILQVGFWRRFAEPHLRLRSLLRSGAIGRPTAIRASQWDACPPPPGFCDPSSSGGIEVDCGVHEIDLARWILEAEPLAAAAAAPACTGPLADVGDVETVLGLVRLTGERTMTVDLTRTAGHRDSIRTEVIGTAGSAVVDFAETGTIVVRSTAGTETLPLAAEDVIDEALRGQLHAFSRAIESSQAWPDAAGAVDSCRATVACQALRRARVDGRWHEAGTTVEAPPADSLIRMVKV